MLILQLFVARERLRDYDDGDSKAFATSGIKCIGLQKISIGRDEEKN